MQVSSLGRYVIRGEIGRGNMGVVYRAYDPVIDRLVALKTINLPENLPRETRDSFLERFLREARVAGKLLHPNIVVTYDASTDEGTGIPFIVMELVEGETLSERLRQQGALPWNEAVELFIPLARALEYAHDNGIVHRDIKPSNVILTRQGVPKIADFGIAKLPAAESTETGTVMGTPHSMSPEQLMGKPIDRRSDVFSLGVLLYNCISGSRPFDGPDVPTIVAQVLYKNPSSVSGLNPEVPDSINAVLARALEKDPQRRYGSVTALVEDLLAVRRGEVPTSTLSLCDDTLADGEVIPTGEEGRRQPGGTPPRKRRRRWGLGIGLTLTAALCVALWVFFGGLERPGWELPLEMPATHHHMIGNCSGRLILHEWGVEYRSQEHGTWGWEWSQIQEMERKDPRSFSLESREDKLLGLAGNKRYDFTLGDPGLEDDFWTFYRAIASSAEPLTGESPSREEPSPPVENEDSPTEADLFYDATVAFENGDLEESQRNLEDLLQKDPDFTGAAQLLQDVDVRLWKETLPLSFRAQHNHRIGHCTGELSLTDWGIEFRSVEHGLWRWTFDEIRIMARPSRWRLELETEEMDLLAMGRSKKYKFVLQDAPLEDEAWRRYQRLAEKKW